MGGKGTGITQEKERIHRINVIWELQMKNPEWCRERLIAEYQLNYGSSRRVTLDYLKVLETTGRIKWEK